MSIYLLIYLLTYPLAFLLTCLLTCSLTYLLATHWKARYIVCVHVCHMQTISVTSVNISECIRSQIVGCVCERANTLLIERLEDLWRYKKRSSVS